MTAIRLRGMEIVIFVVLLLGKLTYGGAVTAAGSSVDPIRVPFCPKETVVDSILGFRDRHCHIDKDAIKEYPRFVGVTKGDEVSLQMALDMIYNNNCQYAAVLFYASWCPFSRSFGPSFSFLSSLYPSIPHIAVEESSVTPSTLSIYGVHGFPTLFLMNSTMRVRYGGSRTLGSLVAFYGDVTGIKTNVPSVGKSTLLGDQDKDNKIALDSCPFSWVRSPENLLRQETYLAFAIIFVLLRIVFLCFPTLLLFGQSTWRWFVRNISSISLLEHPFAFLNRLVQLFKYLKEPCKRRNLQDGAMSARVWASKSLATVSIGEASTSRVAAYSGI